MDLGMGFEPAILLGFMRIPIKEKHRKHQVDSGSCRVEIGEGLQKFGLDRYALFVKTTVNMFDRRKICVESVQVLFQRPNIRLEYLRPVVDLRMGPDH